MNAFCYFVKRNMKIYYRDRAAIFFSLLSVFIVITLMVFFLGDMNKQSVLQLLETYGGKRNAGMDSEHAYYLVIMWTIAGMLIVNSVTIPLSLIGAMVTDKQTHTLESFYTSPIPRSLIALSYGASAILAGMFMCILTLFLSFLFVIAQGFAFLSLGQLLQVLLLLLLSVTLSSSIFLPIALVVSSPNAWSGLATVVSTIIGFLGGIYVPLGALPSIVKSILKFQPFLYETSLMRSIFTSNALETTFHDIPSSVVSEYKEAMGISITLFENNLSNHLQVCFLLICTILFIGLTLFLFHKQTRRNS